MKGPVDLFSVLPFSTLTFSNTPPLILSARSPWVVFHDRLIHIHMHIHACIYVSVHRNVYIRLLIMSMMCVKLVLVANSFELSRIGFNHIFYLCIYKYMYVCAYVRVCVISICIYFFFFFLHSLLYPSSLNHVIKVLNFKFSSQALYKVLILTPQQYKFSKN